MTPDQFREALHTLGLNQSQAAQVLGYGAAPRISEVLNGKKKPNGSVVRLLQAYLDGYRPPDWPKQ